MIRRLVVDMQSERPVWRIQPGVVQQVRAALGSGWDVVHIAAPASSDSDGGRASAEAVAAARGAEIYFGYGIPAEVVAAGTGSLRWVHTGTAGVAGSLAHLQGSGIALTNSAGIHAEPMADWVIAAIAHFARGFDAIVRAQAASRWIKATFGEQRVGVRELADHRVGIVGVGGTGSAVARRALALGMSVAGIRRRPELGGPPGLRWVGGSRDIGRLAAESDVLVVTAPRTDATATLIDRAVLSQLPSGALVINVSRGTLIDELAVVTMLNAGRLRGVALDVFATEPLPDDHPLWRHPRALVSPHVSSITTRFWEREAGLMLDNVRRYLAGTPLRNVVDLESGY